MPVLQPPDDDLDDGEGHRREGGQRLVPMDPLPQVHLGDGLEAVGVEDVDEQPGLHAVAGEEGEPLQRLAPAGVLPGQRLDEAGEFGEEEVEQGAGGQFGHPAATAGEQFVPLPQGAAVEPLDVLDPRLPQQGAEDAVDEAGMDVDDVGVDPGDDVALKDVEALPQRLPLAPVGPVLGEDLLVDVDRDA